MDESVSIENFERKWLVKKREAPEKYRKFKLDESSIFLKAWDECYPMPSRLIKLSKIYMKIIYSKESSIQIFYYCFQHRAPLIHTECWLKIQSKQKQRVRHMRCPSNPYSVYRAKG